MNDVPRGVDLKSVPDQSTRLLEWVLVKLRYYLSAKLFETSRALLVRCGQWGLVVAAVVILLYGTYCAIKAEVFSVFWLGFGWVFLLAVLQFIAARLLPSEENLISTSSSQLSSVAFLECLGLLFALASVFCAVRGLVQAIRAETLVPLWSGLGSFLFFVFLTALTLRPELVNVNVVPGTRAGQEAIGLATFFIKTFIKLVPVMFGAGILVGTLSLLVQVVNVIRAGGVPPGFTAVWGSLLLIGGSAILPLLAFVGFICAYLSLDIIGAILSIPGKLDRMGGGPDTLG